MTNRLSLIKSQIMQLYQQNQKVHIDFFFKRERKQLADVPAVITAVYSNLFIAKLWEGDAEKTRTFQYVDLLTHTLEIRELKESNDADCL